MIMKRNIFQILTQVTRRISSQASNKYVGFDLNNYRSLLRVKGADAAPFLQNLITNDINNLSTVENQVIFSMILNNRGRILFDVLIYNIISEESQIEKKNMDFLVEIDSNFQSQALKTLNMFKIKKKVFLTTDLKIAQ
jgi:folate-binding Fe-S cluster repair protein YgfZ